MSPAWAGCTCLRIHVLRVQIPPRNRPKALPTGSLKQLSQQLALLSDDGGAATTASASDGPADSTDSNQVFQRFDSMDDARLFESDSSEEHNT